jgi:hydroxymethylbilane synthase
MTVKRLIIGTRGSELARWQSNFVKSELRKLFPALDVELQIIKTLGDKILDSPLSRIGDKGLFTKEIDHALVDRTIDIAVHSAKDVPTILPAGLTIGAVVEREDVRDAFIAHPAKNHRRFGDLPRHAKIATGSLRRRCQLLQIRPDLEVIDIRGNLNTRLKKLATSDWDGMVLARAGVKRLGWEERIAEVLPVETMLPAVGQGALAIVMRESDESVREVVQKLHHESTAVAVNGERAFLRFLEGGCQVPIGTYGRLEDGKFRLDALIGSLDGRRVVRGSIGGSPAESEALGIQLAKQLLERGGREILSEIRTSQSAAKPSHV